MASPAALIAMRVSQQTFHQETRFSSRFRVISSMSSMETDSREREHVGDNRVWAPNARAGTLARLGSNIVECFCLRSAY
jgi:hypothetical protein